MHAAVEAAALGTADTLRQRPRLIPSQVRHRIIGNGPPLLLLNGLFQSMDSWQPIADELATAHTVICCDLPNQGRRSVHPWYCTFDRYVEFVRDFVSAIQIPTQQLTVFGFSFGAEIARALHFDAGVPFRRLVLGSISPPGIEKFWPLFFQNMHSLVARRDIEALVRAVGFHLYSPQHLHRMPKTLHLLHLNLDDCFGSDIRSLQYLVQAQLSRNFDAARARRAPGCPIDVLAADQDSLAPLMLVRDYATALPATLHVIEAGHSFPFEQPGETLAVLQRILEEPVARNSF